MKLSDEQKRAIETIDKNVIVNAGAGTGKTEVLTRRYLEILKNGKFEEGEEVSSIVAITFTIKAANEMKERIREKLIIDKDLENYIEDINDAQISTIHSFCTKLIREYSYDLDIDPDFEIFEDLERNNILRDIIKTYLAEEECSDYLLLLQESIENNDLEKIVDELVKLFNSIKNTTLSISSIRERTFNNLETLNKSGKIEEIKDELFYINDNVKLRTTTKLSKFLQNDSNIDNIENIQIFNKLYESISIKNIDELIRLVSEHIEFREYKLKEVYVFLFNILEYIENQFYIQKRKIGKLDFNDLEHFALELLNKKNIQEKIQSKINYLMVDEYQDSNDIQKEIFYKICSKKETLDRNIFFGVGDPKQSIYGFRGANIYVFDNTRLDISGTGDEISFVNNYRSNNSILEGINLIYKNIMGNRYTSLKGKEELISKESSNKIVYFNNDDKKDDNFEPNNISNYIACETNNNKIYGDYTLLFRKKKDQVVFEEHLAKRNIPFYTFNSVGFYKSQEIILIKEILKLVKNQSNNYSYYYILKSYLYGCKDQELLYWKCDSYNIVEECICDLKKKIFKLKNISKKNIFEFLNQVYNEFKLIEIYNYNERNIQKQGNLYKLLEIASEFDSNNLSYDEFFHFLIDNKDEENMKQVENEDSNIVKLMTIHGSKGLGFDNVIIPYINKTTNGNKDVFLYDKRYGISINLKLANSRYSQQSENLKIENEREIENIYYVAMTRAKKSLVLGLSGQKSGFKKRLIEEIKELENNDLIEKKHFDEYIEKKNDTIKKDYIRNDLLNSAEVNNYANRKIYTNISKILDFYNKLEVERVEIRNYDNENLSNNIIGNVIHRYAELYDGEDLDIEKILDEFGLKKSKYIKIEKYINNIKLMHNITDIYYKEVPFIFKYNNVYFSGVIDKIEKEDNKLRIIDYKFSNLNENQIIKKYWIQLVFYGIVCEKMFANKDIELLIKNIRKNYQVKINFDDKRKKEFFKILENYLSNI